MAGGSGNNGQSDVVSSVGLAILAAAVLAFVGHLLKQPLLLAYIAGGIVIGPHIGLGLIKDTVEIETISHFGLILLMFLIGLAIWMMARLLGIRWLYCLNAYRSAGSSR